MNYADCIKKYPIGFSVGKFTTEKEDYFFTPYIRCDEVAFLVYCFALHSFYTVSFYFDTVFSYLTKDGENFYPIMKDFETEQFVYFPSSFLSGGLHFHCPDDDDKLIEAVMNLWNYYKGTNNLLQDSVVIENVEEYDKYKALVDN